MSKNSALPFKLETRAAVCQSLLCILAGMAMLSGQAVAAEPIAPPAKAKAMTAVELYLLYRNKTWVWPDGAGRLQEQGRIFIGWSGSVSDVHWADGRWVLTDTGLMCLKANWYSPNATVADKTCFSHRIDGDTIYQKKEPDGSWYVFKHAKPADGDEFQKLVSEDTVSAKLASGRPLLQVTADSNQPPLSAQAPNGAN